MRDRLRAEAGFADAARLTADVAAELFGPRSGEVEAVRYAWREVGVMP
jgi:Zn-dependent metalloprotease